MRKKMIMEISSGLLPIGIPDDWVSRLDYKWIMAIGNHKDATITFDEKQWGDFLDDIRKGHEAAIREIGKPLVTNQELTVLVYEKDDEIRQLKVDLATCKDVGNRLMKRNSELEDKIIKLENQDYSKYCLSCDRQERVSDLFRQLESKCKECIDLRLELSAAQKEIKQLKEAGR